MRDQEILQRQTHVRPSQVMGRKRPWSRSFGITSKCRVCWQAHQVYRKPMAPLTSSRAALVGATATARV